MKPDCRLLALFAFLVAVGAAPSRAEVPVIGSDECLYLVGAPAGEPAAEVEERTEGQEILGTCGSLAGVALNRDRENQVQAWMVRDPDGAGFNTCTLKGWVGHRFSYGGERPALATIRLAGAVDGLLRGSDTGGGGGASDNRIDARLMVELVSLAPSGAGLARQTVVLRQLVNSGEVDLQSSQGAELQHVVLPGRVYEVRLRLELGTRSVFEDADLGASGGGRDGATYDAIEVCATPLARGGGAGDLELEALLHEGRCLAGIWLPEALGGRLQEARDLVQTRLDGAETSGARGVNLPVARRNLDAAEGAMEGGDYQRACRELGHALRAVTTP